PDSGTGESGRLSHSGNCSSSSRRTRSTSVSTSSACRLAMLTAALHRLVPLELALEDALAPRETAQLLLELQHPGGAHVTGHGRPGAVQLGRLHYGTQSRERGVDGRERVRREAELESVDRLAHDRPGLLQRLPEDERRQVAYLGGLDQGAALRG